MSSLTIAVIGFIESIIVAKLYANKNNYYVSPNRELVAVGKFHNCWIFFVFFLSNVDYIIKFTESHSQKSIIYLKIMILYLFLLIYFDF
jgi:hypothetical protein